VQSLTGIRQPDPISGIFFFDFMDSQKTMFPDFTFLLRDWRVVKRPWKARSFLLGEPSKQIDNERLQEILLILKKSYFFSDKDV